MAKPDEMLLCPFCGELPDITKHFRDEAYKLIHRCPVLGPIVFDWREEKAKHIEHWNTRHDAKEKP